MAGEARTPQRAPRRQAAERTRTPSTRTTASRPVTPASTHPDGESSIPTPKRGPIIPEMTVFPAPLRHAPWTGWDPFETAMKQFTKWQARRAHKQRSRATVSQQQQQPPHRLAPARRPTRRSTRQAQREEARDEEEEETLALLAEVPPDNLAQYLDRVCVDFTAEKSLRAAPYYAHPRSFNEYRVLLDLASFAYEVGDLPQERLLREVAQLATDEWIYTYRPDAVSSMGMAAPSLASSSYHTTTNPPPPSDKPNPSEVTNTAKATHFVSVESELIPGETDGRGSMAIPYFGGRGVGVFAERQRWIGSVVKM